MTTYVIKSEGQEDFFTSRKKDFRSKPESFEDMAQRACRHWGLTTPRSAPEAVPMAISEMGIVDGKQVPHVKWSGSVEPPLSRMTAEEHDEANEKILADIPVEFHAALKHRAYEEGHSSGYESCVNCLADLVSDLEDSIRNYTLRLIREREDDQYRR